MHDEKGPMAGHPGGHCKCRSEAGHPGSSGHPGAHPGEKKHLMAPIPPRDPRDVEVDPEEVNNRRNYSLHAAFKLEAPLPAQEVAKLAAECEAAVKETGVEIRGWYDCSGFRSDADLLLWFLGYESIDQLQDAYRAVVNSTLGMFLKPVFSIMSAHMTAEFNRPHLPACFGGWAPRKYLAVYPFTRSLQWYYLKPQRRRAMLAEHGMNGKDYLDVGVSTLATFALSDYEWTLSLEHDDIDRVMGVLRVQRNCEARLHVREDTPFYTGRRMELAEWAGRMPAFDCCDDDCDC